MLVEFRAALSSAGLQDGEKSLLCRLAECICLIRSKKEKGGKNDETKEKQQQPTVEDQRWMRSRAEVSTQMSEIL